MKLLSIDIGIKNLALCIIENIDDKIFKIVFWQVINLCEENIDLCNYCNNTKTPNKPCNKPAKFFKHSNYYCKLHSCKSDYKILPTEFYNYNRLKINSLIDLAKEYNIPRDIPPNKENIIKNIQQYINNNYLEYINKNTNANDINLIDIGISIKNNLDKINFDNIDKVLIENQISPIATRMKSIQGMISQYFILKNIFDIQFISSANKLKLFSSSKNTTYNERKKLSIEYTKDLLNKYNIDENYITSFVASKKKDDLADCFLQGYWFLITNNIIKTQ
ncbi:MAG: hypothetical protein ACYSOT_07080 [Planctomycetota bacterium]|jgi:hypothetical protein